jgi:hypothetical protein
MILAEQSTVLHQNIRQEKNKSEKKHVSSEFGFKNPSFMANTNPQPSRNYYLNQVALLLPLNQRTASTISSAGHDVGCTPSV